MSTLSGIVSKGEKGKSKFQSLDINSLYRVSRGESLEQHQQKSTLPRKHGMQSLGKVPSARRPPANLPSLKSEYSSSDPAVSLVPSGGSGWATTKEQSPNTNTTTTTNATAAPLSDTTTNSSSQCVPATTSVQSPTVGTAAPPSSQQQQPQSLPSQQQQQQQNTQSQSQHSSELTANKSSWSAIMSRPGDAGTPAVSAAVGYAGLVGGGRPGRGALGLSFLAHQSPQFQHEFPSLSGQPSVSVPTNNTNQQTTTQQSTSSTASNVISVNAQHQSLLPQQQYPHNHSGAPGQQQSQQNRELNAQYGPGPSLRPQTEGSWIQGGSRTPGAGVGTGGGSTQVGQGPPVGLSGTPGHSEGLGGGRPSLGQSPVMGSVPAGQPNQGVAVSSSVNPTAAAPGPNIHHYRGLIPPFMYNRGNFPASGGFPPQIPSNMSGGGGGGGGPRPRFNPNDRFPSSRAPQERERPPVEEEVITRPIIKEEDLTRMDDISHDPGWAAHDDIDYNQKLAFSDDENEPDANNSHGTSSYNTTNANSVVKKDEKVEQPPLKDDKVSPDTSLDDKERLRDNESPRDPNDTRGDLSSAHGNRPWYQDRMGPSSGGSGGSAGPQRDYRATNGPPIRDNYNQSSQPPMRPAHSLRGVEEEEIWNQRRREHGEIVASAVVRARQRKEEEEKRFQESKQAAAKKLQDLEQKMKKKMAKKEDDVISIPETKGLINIPPVPIPVPEWERERENRERESRDRERSRTSSEGKDEIKPARESRDRDLIRDNRERDSRDLREPAGDFQPNRSNFMRPQQDLTRAERERDRDQRENRDRDQPAFSRQFQSNLPPRFQKQQAERSGGGYNRVSPSAERTTSQPNVPFSQQYDPARWSSHSSSSSAGVKQTHSMPLPQRRRTDSDITNPLDDDPRPPSRDHGNRSRDDRFRPVIHHIFDSRDSRKSGYHDDYNRGYKEDYARDHDDCHLGRESWERDRDRIYDEKDRDSHSRSSRDSREFKDTRDSREFKDTRDFRDRDTRDNREPRDSHGDSRISRDSRESRDKDYDSNCYIKQSSQQDAMDDRELQRERSESGDWAADNRRDERGLSADDNRREPLNISREDRIDRNERPQRPDSRDSRASRESKTSLREDDFHKSRDSSSWVHDLNEYEDKKRELYRDDHHRERERDRRQPPGPITREKLQADELKSEKRNLTQLKRGGSSNAGNVGGNVAVDAEKKENSNKDSTSDVKKEPEVWNRKLERTPETTRSTAVDRTDNSPKAWADAVSPTFEKNEEKLTSQEQTAKDVKDIIRELKASMEKLSVEKREESHGEEIKDDSKDEKRDKNVRNRTNSGSFRGREPSSRGGRTWGGAYNVYTRGWRGSETRGRRGGGSRSMGRPGSAKSGSYGHTDSEISGDEISGSTESGKDERRSAVSPKPVAQKNDKDERNREVSRRDEKRSNEYPPSRGDKRGGFDGRPSREGFAPSGEPSRRGRGGFRSRGATSGGRMEGYGPPPSKSPFSTERVNVDDKNVLQSSPSTAIEVEGNQPSAVDQSVDDKMIAKQQALTAGITGRRNKSPNVPGNQGQKHEPVHGNVGHPAGLQKNQSKKEDARAKRPRSGSRRGRDNRERRGNPLKSNSADVGNEEWETTSENSEEHIDEHKDSRNAHNKHRGAGNQAGSNVQNNRRHEQIGNNRDQQKSKSNVNSRAPGAEKRNGQNLAFNQRNHSGMLPPQGGGTQTQNGRPRSQGSANSGPINEKGNKETTINRVDEIKLSDPNLVDQVMKDMSKKSQSVQSAQSRDKKSVDSEVEANNYSTGGDDGTSAEDKVDADGFQEVRSKKNLKDSRLKEEPKPPRREKDKERERDRSKSKLNGPQPPTPQQIQNIPPLLGQPIPQPANMPKSFDRNPNRNKLAPRFQKQKLAKQQQQHLNSDGSTDSNKVNANSNYIKDSSGNGGNAGGNAGSGPAPPPSVNAWDKPFTSQLRSNSPNSNIPADIQLMSGLTGSDHSHEANEQAASAGSSQRNSPSGEKIIKPSKESAVDKNVSDASSPPVQTLIFENTNYSKTTKTGPEMAIKSKFSNHMKPAQRVDKRDIDEDPNLQQQQQPLSVAFSNKPANELIKDKAQDPIQMPLSFNKSEDSADMKLDFTFDADLSQLTEEKSKSLGMPRSMHMTGAQSTISPSTAELNLKIASVKKVWENASMPTVVEHEDGNVVSTANSFPQSFETADVDDSYPHPQYSQNNMKNEITTSTNVCKVKPQQQSSGSGGAQTGSTVPGPSPIGPGQSPIGHPPASLQGPLSPPPFNSTGQPSHINYQEFPQYPGSQAAQYGSMSAIPSPPAVLFNTGSGQLPAQAGGLYGAFQLDQSRSPFTQYPPYGPSLQSSFNQQNVYLQQPPPPPHAPNAATPDMYQNNLSQYRIPAAAAPPFGQNQQLSNNPNTVLISSSSNSLMSASVKPSSQSIGAIGTKAPHFQAQSAQPNQLAYIPYDPNQVLGVSGNYMGNSQLVQRPGPNVQQTANSYYSATSADVFPGSQTGFYQPGGTQQTGTHYGLQGFGQHSQSLATGNATPVNLQSFSSQFLSGSGLQIAAAAAAQQYRNPTGGLQGPANAAATFLSKHQQQEQPRQLKSPSGNQQDVLASVFNSTPQIPSPKSRNCKQSQSQQPQPSPTQHHKYQPYQGVGQSALVSSYNNYVIQQNVRGMGMPPRAGIQPSQQRYPPPIQRPVVPFPPGPNPNNPNQQQQNCIPAQQNQVNRHRPNLHQQQQRNMKLQQQYYSGQGQFRNGNKMDPSDKADSHNDKIVDGNAGGQGTGNKSNVSQQDGDVKEEVNQQNE
ncbi:protein PRRC2C-like isoform X3 [Cotesia glomerata]|uniref:protein PRRC2C-like isoform X3 n=1 Tax=Cotesia glomerata TaxID=32391 RepID=UPI001D02FC44|nr:protein PRRC2C-like isoform X3 [Cotesia glomerata]